MKLLFLLIPRETDEAAFFVCVFQRTPGSRVGPRPWRVSPRYMLSGPAPVRAFTPADLSSPGPVRAFALAEL